ncbi:sodium:proton exchanger [Candidatus Kaiserbacteria bacterium RIFCSPHIGHO2_02_FULL_49_34]|uniref:Sodium:proton exchanger n=1 Tax=Candidatus Kaiserbacteria bacterium RIFCSPHIGHO2_02_FULL_49_34 TaxID=1798491 RepID=A0A1F6DKE2_9BACT|nr:MAG: sodium:proton exchanger [Candidatus Kaiserbacteria bacterium RIFCSPHIGHO2_02_FULL_49_34]
MISFILLCVGLALLVKGGGLFVDGSVSIARIWRIPPIVIGLTLVSIGTSLPELVVNLFAAGGGSTDLAIGNILGSNITNILLVLGICSAIYPLSVSKGTVSKEIPLAILATIALGFLANDAFFDGGVSMISRSDGLALLCFFSIFLYYIFELSRRARKDDAVGEDVEQKYTGGKAAVAILFGAALLGFGGKLAVDNAIILAIALNVPQSIIGLTIVAIGTSLPELVTSVIATMKRHSDIAIGNIVGSNIFNIFWILGVSAIVTPLPFAAMFTRDLLVALVASILLFLFMFLGKRDMLKHWQGLIFLGMYFGYVAVLVLQQVL